MNSGAEPREPPGSYSISRNTMEGELVKLGLLMVIALILTFMLSVLAAGLVLFVILDLKDSGPDFLFPLLAGFFGLIGLAISWQWMKRTFQFRLDIHPDRLQTRTFWLYDSLDPLEVEGIKLARQSVNSLGGGHVEIVGGGKIWRLFLAEKNIDCINDLLKVCPNATYFDAFGQEHPPKQPFHPEKVRAFLVRRIRRDGIICIITGIVSTLIALLLGVWPIFYGKPQEGGAPLISNLLSLKFASLAAIGINAIVFGIHKIREASRLAQQDKAKKNP